jgi:myo-inositol-1(or 4)-monophosphatase
MTFSQKDFNHLLDLAKRAALLAEPILLKYFGQLESVDEKHQAGLVTKADVESEQVITDFFRKHTPDFDFIGEEASYGRNLQQINNASSRKPCWIVDPLDGTTNYVHGFPIFCISIGLEFEGQCLVGVIQAPAMRQMFSAAKGCGAWLNNRQIHVSQRSKLEDSLVATGFITSHKDKLKHQLQLFNQVIDQVRGLRRPGAAAYDLAMIASGVFDAFWEESLSPWDTCAGVALVEEAGGIVTQFDGSSYNPFCSNVLATNQLLHNKFKSLLSSR